MSAIGFDHASINENECENEDEEITWITQTEPVVFHAYPNDPHY